MESGTIEKWHKKEGDHVKVGDVLFEVMTDKVSLEVESYDSGILRKILKGAGEEVPVTEVVAYIGSEDEKIPEPVSGTVESGEPVKKAPTGNNAGGSQPRSRKRIRISPLARKTADKLGVDWKSEMTTGTGLGGRITKEDVIAFSRKSDIIGKLKVRSSTTLAGIKKLTAERMSLSKSSIPHIVLNARADVTGLIKFREELNESTSQSIRITFTDIILKATALALRKNIEVNSTLKGNEYIIYEDINVGIAIAVGDGLIVPVLLSCDKLDIPGIAKIRSELVKQARDNSISLEKLENGTFTVTNLGMFGIRSFSAIINPPQAAILAVGEIYREPAIVEEKMAVRSFMDLSVSCDHRIINGVQGAQFLNDIVKLLEDTAQLVI